MFLALEPAVTDTILQVIEEWGLGDRRDHKFAPGYCNRCICDCEWKMAVLNLKAHQDLRVGPILGNRCLRRDLLP